MRTRILESLPSTDAGELGVRLASYNVAYFGSRAGPRAYSPGFMHSVKAKGAELEEAIQRGDLDDVAGLTFQGDIDRLPENLGALPALRALEVTEHCGTWKARRKAPFDLTPVLACSTLEVLVVRLDRGTHLAPGIGSLDSLRWLGVEATGALEALPDVLDGLTRLERLHVSAAKLSSLPASLGRLASLEHLELRDGAFKELPDLSGLAALRTLVVVGGKLGALPDSLGALGTLRELLVDEAPIRRLPTSVAGLRDIRNFHVWNGGRVGLKRLPSDLGALAGVPVLELLATPDAAARLAGPGAEAVRLRLTLTSS